VGFSYDTANRRSTLTLSNGVNMSYTYDNDSRVTGITYKFNANTLGNLTYSYDSLGRRTQVGGSFAQSRFPAAVASATYDAANELLNWNGTPISYNLNGNMLSDGANTFTWNARNRVAALNSGSLQYDGFAAVLPRSLMSHHSRHQLTPASAYPTAHKRHLQNVFVRSMTIRIFLDRWTGDLQMRHARL
jgi:YD repeat-containing protein